MGDAARKLVTPEEYLAAETIAREKHEYFDGEVVAMAGASLNHNFIVGNLFSSLKLFLRNKGCHVFVADLRVATTQFSSFMYPDITIVCGGEEMIDGYVDTVINPAVIIEVMSPSTMGYDTGRKLFYYWQIPTLREYILIDSVSCNIINYTKNDDDTWLVAKTMNMDAMLAIETIHFEIPVFEIYRDSSVARRNDQA
jgi:Uma2 family endonuclease